MDGIAPLLASLPYILTSIFRQPSLLYFLFLLKHHIFELLLPHLILFAAFSFVKSNNITRSGAGSPRSSALHHSTSNL